jgi:hypothetical protein
MIESVEINTCIACKYYFGDGVDGYCRRFPPREVRSGMMGTFPRTPADGWCGEYLPVEWSPVTLS